MRLPRVLGPIATVALPVLFWQAAPPPAPPAQGGAPQAVIDPFPDPIESTQGAIAVDFLEFATIPDVNGAAPRLMLLAEEPGTNRLFVHTMTGLLYGVSQDGGTVTPYLDLTAAPWSVPVQSRGAERGVQSFAFHPQFAERGAPGYGRFYTYVDITDLSPAAHFTYPSERRSHDTVLLEWTAKDAAAAAYDGGPPRELFRAAQPFSNHNAGHLAFNPLARPGSSDFGLLYVGSADGGSGGDPGNVGQNLGSAFGKILRIDPLGSNSANRQYGIPASNPFVKQAHVLGEIYALGVRNPQRFSWDAKTGRMFVADIGQNLVEEVSPVTAGANLGWNKWEASFAFTGRGISLENPRAEAGLTWPVVEYDHRDPLLQRSSAVTGVYVYRDTRVKALANLLIFGDIPSGEIFYVHADALPEGGQSAIRRILFNDRGATKTLLQLIQDTNQAQGRKPATRADLRLGMASGGRLFVLNKADGIIRLVVPGA